LKEYLLFLEEGDKKFEVILDESSNYDGYEVMTTGYISKKEIEKFPEMEYTPKEELTIPSFEDSENTIFNSVFEFSEYWEDLC